ncbi:MAG: hypothetical protein NBV67_13680 [Tagaea sp.]|nr:hypothetical protein [Tagaea sp.]
MVSLPPRDTPEARQKTLEIFAASIERVAGGPTEVSRAVRKAAETGQRPDIDSAKRRFDKLSPAERRKIGGVAKDLAEEMRQGAKVVKIVESVAADEDLSLELIWPR